LKVPDRVLEEGGRLVGWPKPVPLRKWSWHNKPCAMKGNASVWREARVLC
jgi:hypothetical protein